MTDDAATSGDQGTTRDAATGDRPVGDDAAGDPGDAAPGDRTDGGPDDERSGDPVSALPPRVASSALWGVVGGLSFLVLVQGYELLADAGVSIAAKFVVAAVVAVVAGVSTHLARGRVPVENERD